MKLVTLLLTLPLLACSAPGTPAATPRSAFTLVQIRTGPRSGQLGAEENAHAFEGHFTNMARMAEAGQLVTAGPYGEHRHDPALRGIFVLASGDRAEAEAWAGTDPTTQAGVFVLEFHALETHAPLQAALERDSAWRAERTAAGHPPKPGEGARGYVLLTAAHADLAERELRPLLNPAGGVFLLGRLDGTHALALLDAASLDEARERFGPQLAVLGAHELDEWFASAQLAHLADTDAP